MSTQNSDGFTKYVYTASKEQNCSLKSKTVVQNKYNNPVEVIESMLIDLKKLSSSKNPEEMKSWIKETIPKIETLLIEEKNKTKHAALTRLINNISTQ